MKIQLTSGKESLLKMGTTLKIGQNTYYHLPYWFKKDESGEFELIGIDNIPDELKTEILNKRK